MRITIRKLPPKGLDKFSVSPVGDKVEFARAWDAIKPVGKQLTYLGTDGALHYFQEMGIAEAYCVPVSK